MGRRTQECVIILRSLLRKETETSMHMSDALVSPTVGVTMLAVSGAAIAYSVVKTRKEHVLDDKTVPVMGVMSAFVFAAQMINFTIPGTGSSGHIGGVFCWRRCLAVARG